MRIIVKGICRSGQLRRIVVAARCFVGILEWIAAATSSHCGSHCDYCADSDSMNYNILHNGWDLLAVAIRHLG